MLPRYVVRYCMYANKFLRSSKMGLQLDASRRPRGSLYQTRPKAVHRYVNNFVTQRYFYNLLTDKTDPGRLRITATSYFR